MHGWAAAVPGSNVKFLTPTHPSEAAPGQTGGGQAYRGWRQRLAGRRDGPSRRWHRREEDRGPCRLEGIQDVFALDADPAARRKLGAGPAPATSSTRPARSPVGLQIRELNNGAGVDVAIEMSGSNRGL